jgi:hypothetical protein
MLQMGASFTPIAKLLPIQFLLEILNVGLAQDVGHKIMTGVAKSLDERFKVAFTGDANYQLGDFTKKKLLEGIQKLTGKSSYSFGDISEFVARHIAEVDSSGASGSSSNTSTSAVEAEGGKVLLDISKEEALKEWDKKFVEQNKDDNNSSNKTNAKTS